MMILRREIISTYTHFYIHFYIHMYIHTYMHEARYEYVRATISLAAERNVRGIPARTRYIRTRRIRGRHRVWTLDVRQDKASFVARVRSYVSSIDERYIATVYVDA